MAGYTRDENLADAAALANMLRVIYRCPKPTIARVQGDVYAGGTGLVAACDIAVSVDTAQYCLSEVKLGLIPATISPYVIRAMGARAAHRYFLTAERFSAARSPAHRLRARGGAGGGARRQGGANWRRRWCRPGRRRSRPARQLVQDVAEQDITPAADRPHGAGHRRHPRQRRRPRGHPVVPGQAQAGLAAARLNDHGRLAPPDRRAPAAGAGRGAGLGQRRAAVRGGVPGGHGGLHGLDRPAAGAAGAAASGRAGGQRLHGLHRVLRRQDSVLSIRSGTWCTR